MSHQSNSHTGKVKPTYPVGRPPHTILRPRADSRRAPPPAKPTGASLPRPDSNQLTRYLPGTSRGTERRERPGTCQVKPTYPVPPARRPSSSSRTLLAPAETLFLVPQREPVKTEPFTGEIEAKDGLPSADRNNKATLLLTGPFRTAKSSAKDLTPLVLKLQYAKYQNHSSVAVEESPAETQSRSLFLSIYTCGWYHRVLAWILT